MTSPMPAWAQRRRDEREAEQARRWQARLTTLVGDLLPVSALWSNALLAPYCLDCAAYVPAPFIEMGLPPETICMHCGRRVDAARKVG